MRGLRRRPRSPAFRDALTSRSCLIPADGFYEWVRTGKAKQPYCFEVNEGELFAFAGLWDRWKDPSGQWVKSCWILTTTPNAVTSAVHERSNADYRYVDGQLRRSKKLVSIRELNKDDQS